MDKDDLQHLQEYRERIKILHERLNTMNELIKPLEKKERDSKEDDSVIARVEHDFPNFKKYNKGTDI